jgi:hypothetical protein
MKNKMYVTARASAKPTKSVPHCLWTIVPTIDSCWWELIMTPRRRMMSPGIGFIEKL